MKIPTIEETIALAKTDGFKLNNLCELNNGLWRANFLVGVQLGAEMGEGRTALEAVLNAYGKARLKMPKAPEPKPVEAGLFD